jgi:hypothetical protein
MNASASIGHGKRYGAKKEHTAVGAHSMVYLMVSGNGEKEGLKVIF